MGVVAPQRCWLGLEQVLRHDGQITQAGLITSKDKLQQIPAYVQKA